MRTKEWLKAKRTKLGLSQKELANMCNVAIPTISKIELGERFGSAETWEKIESVIGTDEITYSYESSEIIADLKEDIREFGEDEICYLFYKIKHNYIIFTDYLLKDMEEVPLNNKEKYIVTTLQYAVEVFESQNKII